MALETTEWKITDSLEEDPANIFYYLEAELEEAEPPYAAQALSNVLQVRGGAAKLSSETGVPADVLEKSAAALGVVDRETLAKVMEAFRPRENEASKVA